MECPWDNYYEEVRLGRETLGRRGFAAVLPRLTESAFRRLEVALSSLGIYYYEVVPAWSGNAGAPRLTESASRRLEVVWSSLGIYYYEVVPAWSENAGAPRFCRG